MNVEVGGEEGEAGEVEVDGTEKEATAIVVVHSLGLLLTVSIGGYILNILPPLFSREFVLSDAGCMEHGRQVYESQSLCG